MERRIGGEEERRREVERRGRGEAPGPSTLGHGSVEDDLAGGEGEAGLLGDSALISPQTSPPTIDTQVLPLL